MLGRKGMYVVYARAARSPDGGGASLDAQVKDCIELVRSLGYSKNRGIVLRELGSGTTLDRPMLNHVRGMAAAGKLVAVFVQGTDQLSSDALDLAALVDEFNRHGVEVHFVKGPSGLMPEDDLRRSFLADFARQRRAMIGKRTRKGQMAAARDGRMLTGALSQPFGYDYDPVSKKRVVNEQEAVVVQKIFHQFADGASVLKIARMLNEEGVPTKRAGSLERGGSPAGFDQLVLHRSGLLREEADCLRRTRRGQAGGGAEGRVCRNQGLLACAGAGGFV